MAIRTPHPMPASLRDSLLNDLSHPAFRAIPAETRSRVRNIAVEAYGEGFSDGAYTNHVFTEQERHFAEADRAEPVTDESKPEDPTQTHVWQTLRVIDVGRFYDADDVDARGYEATVVLRCSCGARVRPSFAGSGLTLPPCPEAE